MGTSPLDELPELRIKSPSIKKQDSYLRAIHQDDSSGDFLSSDRATFKIGSENTSPRLSPKSSPRKIPTSLSSSNGATGHMRKQDSYTLATAEEMLSEDGEDYIDKEINRKIALKRTESVKSVVSECITENEDILLKIKQRSDKEKLEKIKAETLE